jgi:general secretion pathway protein H
MRHSTTQASVECHDSGLSLIEMLVILAILSTVVVVSVSSFYRPAENDRLRPLAAEIAAQLRTLRSVAINRNRDQAFVLNSNDRTYAFESLKVVRTVPAAISINLTTARQQVRSVDDARMVFFPDGTSTGGRLVLSQEKRQIVVDIDWLTGTVAIEDVLR